MTQTRFWRQPPSARQPASADWQLLRRHLPTVAGSAAGDAAYALPERIRLHARVPRAGSKGSAGCHAVLRALLLLVVLLSAAGGMALKA